jgi:hypothetical protein
MQEMGFAFYDKNRTGQLMSRLTTDLFEVTELAHHGPEDLFISIVTVIGALIVMFRMQWRLALVVAVIVPLFLLLIGFRRGKIGLALIGYRLIAFAVQDVEKITGLYDIAFLETDLLYISVHLRKKFDLLNGLRVRHKALGQIVNALFNRAHRDRRGHLRLLHLHGRLLRIEFTGYPSACDRGHNKHNHADGRTHRGFILLNFLLFHHLLLYGI